MSMADYSEQTKAAALAALLAGSTFADAARAFGVPIGTLKSWKQRAPAAVDRAAYVDAMDASEASTKKAIIGALLLDYGIASLQALIAQQRVFAHEDWLVKQSAGDVAILHGVG